MYDELDLRNELSSLSGRDSSFESILKLYNLEDIHQRVVSFTNNDPAIVWKRLALEMHRPGYNVYTESLRYNITPHIFDERMIRMYCESDGFVYETSVESINPHRISKWLNVIRYLKAHCQNGATILLYGDSVGSDSVFLSLMGYRCFYHDYDSLCSQYAQYNFDLFGAKIEKHSPGNIYDVVICLEVAEHVENVDSLVRELSALTADNGTCFFSAAFDLLNKWFPTHLSCNAGYGKKIKKIFNSYGFMHKWSDIHGKPHVFAKQKHAGSLMQKLSDMMK